MARIGGVCVCGAGGGRAKKEDSGVAGPEEPDLLGLSGAQGPRPPRPRARGAEFLQPSSHTACFVGEVGRVVEQKSPEEKQTPPVGPQLLLLAIVGSKARPIGDTINNKKYLKKMKLDLLLNKGPRDLGFYKVMESTTPFL